VFALFWLLIVVLLELIALGPLFIFCYVLIVVARAGELIPEYDYADDFARPTDSEIPIRHCYIEC
jgi:hypothetical protein